MALLDVNALVALVWDSHIHHVAMRRWFDANHKAGWATCPVTESGFVRVSSNRKAMPSPIGIGDALRVLASLRGIDGHRFLVNDVSPVDADVPAIASHRDVTDAQLATLARRHGMKLLTFDAGIARFAGKEAVELLRG